MKKIIAITIATILALSLTGCSFLTEMKDDAINKINENVEEAKNNFNNILENPGDILKISSIVENSEVNLVSTYSLDNGKDAYIFDVELEASTIHNINLIYMNEGDVHLIGHNKDKTHYLFIAEVDDIKPSITVEASYPGLSNVTSEKEFGEKNISDILKHYPAASQYLEVYCPEGEKCEEEKYETGIINIGNDYYFLQKNNGLGTIGKNTDGFTLPSCYKLVYLSGVNKIETEKISFISEVDAKIDVVSDDCSSLKNETIQPWNRCLGLNIENDSNINIEKIISEIEESGVIEFENIKGDKYLLPLK